MVKFVAALCVLFTVLLLVESNILLPVSRKPGRYNVPLSDHIKGKMASGAPVKLGGNIYNYGEFFVPFYLGSPPQFFDAQSEYLGSGGALTPQSIPVALTC